MVTKVERQVHKGEMGNTETPSHRTGLNNNFKDLAELSKGLSLETKIV